MTLYDWFAAVLRLLVSLIGSAADDGQRSLSYRIQPYPRYVSIQCYSDVESAEPSLESPAPDVSGTCAGLHASTNAWHWSMVTLSSLQ